MVDNLVINLQNVCPNVDFSSGNLIDSGAISSLDIVRIIGMLESEYGISLKAKDIIPENFETVDAICMLLAKKSEER